MTQGKRTRGSFGLSVLALFAVAIVAGQARSSQSTDVSRLPTALELSVLTEPGGPVGVNGYEAIRKFKTRPVVIDFAVDALDLAGVVTGPSSGRATIL